MEAAAAAYDKARKTYDLILSEADKSVDSESAHLQKFAVARSPKGLERIQSSDEKNG